MSENPNIPTPGKAATVVAQMFRYGNTPTTEEELAARRSLACARLYKEAREVLPKTHGLDPVGCAHIIGYILGESGVKYDVVTMIERIVRDAVEAAQDPK